MILRLQICFGLHHLPWSCSLHQGFAPCRPGRDGEPLSWSGICWRWLAVLRHGWCNRPSQALLHLLPQEGPSVGHVEGFGRQLPLGSWTQALPPVSETDLCKRPSRLSFGNGDGAAENHTRHLFHCDLGKDKNLNHTDTPQLKHALQSLGKTPLRFVLGNEKRPASTHIPSCYCKGLQTRTLPTPCKWC